MRRGIQGFVLIPKSDENIGVDRGGHFELITVGSFEALFTTKPAKVADDSFAPGRDSRIANAAIFFEGACSVNRRNAEFGAALLEEELVAGTNAQRATDFMRHGDLAFAGDAGLFLQR